MSEMNITPGPWKYGVRQDGTIWLSIGDPAKGPHYQGDLVASEADARLIVAARDHAIVARLLVQGFMRWYPDSKEIIWDGLRHSTEVDEFGVPILTDHLRALITRFEKERS